MEGPAWGINAGRCCARRSWSTVPGCACARRPAACRAGRSSDPFFVAEKSDWVNVVALTPAEELVLVRQYRHGLGRMVLEVPGGCIDPQDTSPEDAARRELLE